MQADAARRRRVMSGASQGECSAVRLGIVEVLERGERRIRGGDRRIGEQPGVVDEARAGSARRAGPA